MASPHGLFGRGKLAAVERLFARYKPEMVALHHRLSALDLATRNKSFDTPRGIDDLLGRAPIVHRWHYTRIRRAATRPKFESFNQVCVYELYARSLAALPASVMDGHIVLDVDVD